MPRPFVAKPACTTPGRLDTRPAKATRGGLRWLALVCAGSALLACSVPKFAPDGPAAGAKAEAGADAYYALGRNHYAARRYDAAAEAYQRALALSPRHVDARNGVAALHAARGEFAAAIAIWRDLTTGREQAQGKQAALLFNNLGYAYLLAGDAAQALAALERACLLDPLNDRAWENLGLALHRLGEHERAVQVTAQSTTLRQHDLEADFAMVEKASALPLLEISNGNGVKGMAAALGRRVDRTAYQLARLSNQRGFAVQRTRIEYRQGNEDAAYKLAAWLQATPPGKGAPLLLRVPVDGAAIRLVIGRDLVT